MQIGILGNSLVRSLVRSYRSLVRSLAHFAQWIIRWLFCLCFFPFSTIVERGFGRSRRRYDCCPLINDKAKCMIRVWLMCRCWFWSKTESEKSETSCDPGLRRFVRYTEMCLNFFLRALACWAQERNGNKSITKSCIFPRMTIRNRKEDNFNTQNNDLKWHLIITSDMFFHKRGASISEDFCVWMRQKMSCLFADE